MSDLCDMCDVRPGTLEIRLQRPSDSSDLCCVMLVCDTCMKPASLDQLADPEGSPSGNAATPEVWERYMESKAAIRNGHYFLT